MNVLLISTQYPPRLGGVAIATQRMAQALCQAGHNVYVVTRLRQGDEVPNSRAATNWMDGPVHVFGYAQSNMNKHEYGVTLSDVKFNVKDKSIDVVYAYYLNPAGYFACAIANYLNVPSVVSMRGDDVTYSLCVRPSEVVSTLKASTLVTTVSKSLAEWMNLLVPELDCLIIENSVPAEFSPDPDAGRRWRNLLEIPENSRVIASNAVFRWKKNPNLLLQLVREIASSSIADITFLKIGDFGEESEVMFREALHSASSASKKRRLIALKHPERTELPAVMNAADILISTSIREGMPNVLLEAMACGTPIAATPVNGSGEILRRSEVGIAIDPYDVSSSSSKIVTLLQSVELKERMSRNGALEVEKNHRIARELAEVEEAFGRATRIYEETLRSNQGIP